LGMFIKPYDTKRLANKINICNCFDAEKLYTNSNFYAVLHPFILSNFKI
jgi:hypothetical protein